MKAHLLCLSICLSCHAATWHRLQDALQEYSRASRDLEEEVRAHKAAAEQAREEARGEQQWEAGPVGSMVEWVLDNTQGDKGSGPSRLGGGE